VSIIVEILQMVDAASVEDAIKLVFFLIKQLIAQSHTDFFWLRYHFDSLAHDNSATSSEVSGVEMIANPRTDDVTPHAMRLSGVQMVPKFNRETPDRVLILMALYRVTEKSIDMVVTFNVPLESEDGGAVSDDNLPSIRNQFDQFTRSFRILDFGLFA
jgi:hypothetical protein